VPPLSRRAVRAERLPSPTTAIARRVVSAGRDTRPAPRATRPAVSAGSENRSSTAGEHAQVALLVPPVYYPLVTREEVQRLLAKQRAELTSLRVRSLHVFGSVARGDSAPDSDVDLLVDFDRPIGLFHFFRVQQRLERILGSRVDLVMREAVKPQLRDRILGEAVRAT